MVLMVLEVILVVLGVVLVVLGVVLETVFGTNVRNRQCAEQCSEPTKGIQEHVRGVSLVSVALQES